mmetsp:Transcript_80369/g.209634  ORF Transcript_80369/g.209634 Transcript_80369/m.209634 type:complete len:368 (-) Transcript_80369:367-1470(-)
MSQVAVILDIVPQLRSRDRCQIRCVFAWNTNAVWGHQALSPVQTLGGQLVVSEGAQQLADYDIGLLRRIPESAVFAHDVHIGPALELAAVPEGDDRVRVLLQRPYQHLHAGPLRGAPRGYDQGASARAHHDEHEGRRLPGFDFPLQRPEDGMLVLDIFDGVLLKRLVRLRLQVVLQRLQGRLQVVVVRELELLLRRERGATLEQSCNVMNVLGCLLLCVAACRQPLQDHLDTMLEHLHQKRLVSLRQHRETLLVCEENVGRDHDRTDRFCKPPLKLAISVRQVLRELEGHLQARVLVAKHAEHVPRVPTVYALAALVPGQQRHADHQLRGVNPPEQQPPQGPSVQLAPPGRRRGQHNAVDAKVRGPG